jgi:hypothetical protein
VAELAPLWGTSPARGLPFLQELYCHCYYSPSDMFSLDNNLDNDAIGIRVTVAAIWMSDMLDVLNSALGSCEQLERICQNKDVDLAHFHALTCAHPYTCTTC